MKTGFKKALLLTALIGVGFFPSLQSNAQTLTNLHTFAGGTGGANPYAGLVLAGDTLYGTTFGGGISEKGTVFSVNTNGGNFTVLHTFAGATDGANPNSKLLMVGNTLYGGTFYGGGADMGVVFAISTNGINFTNLHSFNGTDGADIDGTLIASGNVLYGTTFNGGVAGVGTVFSLHLDGSSFTNLYQFAASNDGNRPYSGLLLAGNTLYGSTEYGGTGGVGILYAVNTNGTGYTNLHNFNNTADGGNPVGGLILISNFLYGAALFGGSANDGTIYTINTNGSGFTNLHNFTGGINGQYPEDELKLSGATLYGTTLYGGPASVGNIFSINLDGSSYVNLHNFNGTNEQGYPYAGMILAGNTLYGTAERSATGSGTVFGFILPTPPSLTIARNFTNAVVTWPTHATSYTLQSTTNLLTTAWGAASPSPVIVNGKNTVTNPVAGVRKFYRLIQ